MKITGGEKDDIYEELLELVLSEENDEFFDTFSTIFSPQDAVEYEAERREFERQMRRELEEPSIPDKDDD